MAMANATPKNATKPIGTSRISDTDAPGSELEPALVGGSVAPWNDWNGVTVGASVGARVGVGVAAGETTVTAALASAQPGSPGAFGRTLTVCAGV